MSEVIRLRPNMIAPKTGIYRLMWENGKMVVERGSPVECRQVEGKRCPATNNSAQVWEYHRDRSAKQWAYDKRRRATKHRRAG